MDLTALKVCDRFGQDSADFFSVQIDIIYPFYFRTQTTDFFYRPHNGNRGRGGDENRTPDIKRRLEQNAHINSCIGRREKTAPQTASAMALMEGKDCGTVLRALYRKLFSRVICRIHRFIDIDRQRFPIRRQMGLNPLGGQHIAFYVKLIAAICSRVDLVSVFPQCFDRLMDGGSGNAHLLCQLLSGEAFSFPLFQFF